MPPVTPPRSKSRAPLLVGALSVPVLLVLGLIAFLLLRPASSSPKPTADAVSTASSSATATATAATPSSVLAAFAPLRQSQAALDAALRRPAGPAALAAVRSDAAGVSRNAQALQASLPTLGVDTAHLGPLTNGLAAQARMAQQLQSQAGAVAGVDISVLHAAETSRLDAQRAYGAAVAWLGQSPADVSQSVTPYANGLARVKAQEVAQHAFVSKVEDMLQQSAHGRSEVSSAISQVSACQLTPDEAATRIDSVASNRQSLLTQLSALDAPTPKLGALENRLQEAFQHSIEADREYALWVDDEVSWYYTEPVGCPTGALPQDDAAYRSGYQQSLAASGAKRTFLAGFNPLARAQGLRTWTEPQI